jgi:O-antigen/teichoic acid export membrane protein
MTAVAAGRRTDRGSLIGLGGAAVNGVLGFALTAVVLGGLGAAGAGEVFTAIAIVSIAGSVCCAGADTALIWAVPRREPTHAGRLLPVALAPGLGAALIVAAVGVAYAGPLAGVLLAGPDSVPLLRLTSAAVPIVVAATVLLAAVRATRPTRDFIAVQSVGLPLARLALVAAMAAASGGGAVAVGDGATAVGGGTALLGGGAVAAFTGWLLPAAVAVAVAAALLVRPLGLCAGIPRPDPADWRTFWGFAAPRAVSAAIDAGSMWVGVVLTSALAGAAAAGVFAGIGRYALGGLLVMQALRIVAAPKLSRMLGAGLRHEAAGLYRRTTVATIALSWPVFIVLAVFAPGFLGLFGAEYATGAAALAVLCAAMLVNSGVGIVQTLLLMSGHSGRHLGATALGLALNVGLCVVLVPRHGTLGAALAWAVAITAENAVAAAAARVTVGVPLFTRPLFIAAAVSAAAATGLTLPVAAVLGRGVAGLATTTALLAVAGLLALRRPRLRAQLLPTTVAE